MDNSLTPNAICSDLANNRISHSLAADLLISLIEGSDDPGLREQSVLALQKVKIKSDKIYKIVENSLISDENAIVRSAAAQIIIRDYIEQGANSIGWTIKHDKSPLVLKSVINLADEFRKTKLLELVNLIQTKIEKIAKSLGIVKKEAIFILDIEAIFAMKKPSYELDLKIYDLYKDLGDSWLTIKNEHIESLYFNFFNWFLLKENPYIYNSLSQLRFPEVYLNLLNDLALSRNEVLQIPSSIGNLTLLKNLDLSHNYIQGIPKSIELLKNLTTLNLSWNSFHNIPESIFSLSSLKKLDLSHNNIKEVPEKINILKSLNDLNLDNNLIGNLSDSLREFFNTLEKFSY